MPKQTQNETKKSVTFSIAWKKLSEQQKDNEFAALLARCRSGDEQAMTEIVKLYESEVRMVARARLGPGLRPHLDSVDLVQSLHRSLLIGLRNDRFSLNSKGELLALAITIVQRKAARHWRKNRRQHRLSGGWIDNTCSLHHVLLQLHSTDDDPAKSLEIAELIDELLKGLQSNDQELLRLRLMGFSTVEAAKKLGLDPDVTRARLSRIRRSMRQAKLPSELI